MYHDFFGLREAPFRITPNTDFFFAGGNRASMILFAFALPLAPALCWRRGGVRRALAFVAAAAPFCLVPIIAIAQWKEYYFHPRHVLFLLPTTLLAARSLTENAHQRARFALTIGTGRRDAKPGSDSGEQDDPRASIADVARGEQAAERRVRHEEIPAEYERVVKRIFAREP